MLTFVMPRAGQTQKFLTRAWNPRSSWGPTGIMGLLCQGCSGVSLNPKESLRCWAESLRSEDQQEPETACLGSKSSCQSQQAVQREENAHCHVDIKQETQGRGSARAEAKRASRSGTQHLLLFQATLTSNIPPALFPPPSHSELLCVTSFLMIWHPSWWLIWAILILSN